MRINESLTTLISYPLSQLAFNIVFLLIGFFAATVLATLTGQTGDWGIVAGGRNKLNKAIVIV
uniref:Uncharacterized protein n=1 Tax=Compsopogon caeruleus TaxID=31354 RepID=A0A1Z1XB08_9RHOD|nr:hypothetical protein [Compsopogon caeruleus]ARX96039.1 hypothetical protein [Compsopogon caeruleus]